MLQVVEAQPDMSLASTISLYVALLAFVLSVHSDHLEYVDQVLVCLSQSFYIQLLLFQFGFGCFRLRKGNR